MFWKIPWTEGEERQAMVHGVAESWTCLSTAQFFFELKYKLFIVFFIKFKYILSEKAMAPHSSTLAWKIPWMEEPGRLQSMGSLRVGHD